MNQVSQKKQKNFILMLYQFMYKIFQKIIDNTLDINKSFYLISDARYQIINKCFSIQYRLACLI